MPNLDDAYMKQVFQLALKGKGVTSPNPMVGAVLVRDGELVGEGFHQYHEQKHAEVLALDQAGEKARGATLYVNLEPCCHRGRTGPCCRYILDSGVARVVAAMRDPNPLVKGKGFEQLTMGGVEVVWGTMESEAQRLNEAYVKYITSHIPFVIAKTGATLDGKISSGLESQQWITSVESRHRGHQLRLEADAILVGIGTILKDDPRLTDRSGQPRRRPLLRVVLDSQLRLPLDSQLARTHHEGAIILFCADGRDRSRQRQLENAGMEIIPAFTVRGRVPLEVVLETLGQRQVMSLLIEGGAEVNFEAVQTQIVDKLICFLAPKILGGTKGVGMFGGTGFFTLDQAPSLLFSKTEKIGPDLMIEAYFHK